MPMSPSMSLPLSNVLTVPEESVIHSGTRNVVVLDQGDGTFQVSEVTPGREWRWGLGNQRR